MDFNQIIGLVLGGILILEGLASIITRKVYGMGNSINKYTVESLQKAAPMLGGMNLLAGIGIICSDFLKGGALFSIGGFDVSLGLLILLVAIVVLIVVYLYVTRKVLVKK